MSSISHSVLRACLKAFLGEDDYRKFLEEGARDPLRYWQERAWARFVAAHPSLAVSSQERADALDVCPAHERMLVSGYTEPLPECRLDRPHEWKHSFPRAPLMPLTPHGTSRVLYCPECIIAETNWRKNRLSDGNAPTIAPIGQKQA
jgi:hypothetical protein